MPKSRHTAAYERMLNSLRSARQRAGLTQIDAARRLRRPQSYVSKFECGERHLDLIELALVCRVYGVKLVDLVAELDL